jgi:hypothetical protein
MTFDCAKEAVETIEISKLLADSESSADKESTASCQDSNSTMADDAESLTPRSDSDLEEQEELQRQQEAEETERLMLEEQERRRAEYQRRLADDQRAQEDRMARESVNDWMRKNGFEGMHARKMLSMNTPYPLHCAVKQNDSVMVQLLLKFGADHSATNTWNSTPRQLAAKLNKNASHSEILAMLP